jgi:hypothetical protein
MKKTSIISSIMLVVTALTLSGCIIPFWDDGGGRGGGGGHHEHEHHGEGRH